MYQAYWGLQRSVFTAGAARASLATSPVHAEALARLDFLRESQSQFGLLLGPSGSGKSTVLAGFAEQAERSGALVALVNAAVAEEVAFLMPLALGLKANLEGGQGQLFRAIADRLEEAKLENVSAVVLLDDLDRAAAKTLLLVERLLAIADVPLTIVGAAKPDTARRIGQRLLGQAALRIDLHPWNEEETREYLTTSLTSAGRLQPAFDDAATRRLFELSGGAPRKVNQLAQLALLAGIGEKLTQIDVETIEAVREELSVAR